MDEYDFRDDLIEAVGHLVSIEDIDLLCAMVHRLSESTSKSAIDSLQEESENEQNDFDMEGDLDDDINEASLEFLASAPSEQFSNKIEDFLNLSPRMPLSDDETQEAVKEFLEGTESIVRPVVKSGYVGAIHMILSISEQGDRNIQVYLEDHIESPSVQ